MTNETTASQPKSIGDDAIEAAALKHVATSWGMLPVAAYRSGDYKQTEQFKRLKAFALELLDSRAPAAQASATIQAAPIGWTAKRVDEAGYGNILYSDRSSAEIAISHNGPAAPKYEIVPVFAATVQEPVMVAEPVNVDKMIASGPMGVPVAATVKAVPSEALDSGPFTLEQRMPPKDTEVLIYWPCSDGTFGCAVDEWSDLYEDPIGMGGPTICVGEGWMRYEADVTHWAPIPVVNFAAPLADKTGGGE